MHVCFLRKKKKDYGDTCVSKWHFQMHQKNILKVSIHRRLWIHWLPVEPFALHSKGACFGCLLFFFSFHVMSINCAAFFTEIKITIETANKIHNKRTSTKKKPKNRRKTKQKKIKIRCWYSNLWSTNRKWRVLYCTMSFAVKMKISKKQKPNWREKIINKHNKCIVFGVQYKTLPVVCCCCSMCTANTKEIKNQILRIFCVCSFVLFFFLIL